MKKILSIIIALAMLGCCFPVFAAGAEADLQMQTGKTETELSNGEEVISLMEEAVTVTYPIEKDETWSFENISILSQNITGLDNYVDYVIYYKDGSIKTYEFYKKPKTLSIPAGGKAVITSLGGTVSAVVADDYYLIEEKETPVSCKKALELYESCTYTNKSEVSFLVMYRYTGSSDHGYDYALYDADGNVTMRADNTTGNIEVPAGYSVKITQTGAYGQEFNGLYEKFDLTENTIPVMKRVRVSVGETYTYTNTSTKAYTIRYRYSGSSDHGYDYVMYDADGNVTTYTDNTTGNIEVPALYSVKITQTGTYGQEFSGLYEKFNITKNDEPVMKKVRVSAGETYTYENTGTEAYTIRYRYGGSSDHGYDYVMYDADGNITVCADNTTGNIEVPAGYSVKITQTGAYGQEFNALYEKFNITKNDEPVMKRVKVSAGETYTYKNTSTEAYTIRHRYGGSSDHGFDYVLYYSDGKVKETGSKACKDIEVPAGGSLKITQLGAYAQEFNGLYECFDIDNNSASMPTYKITNIDTIDATLSIKSGYSYDYAIYDADNVLAGYGIKNTSEIIIPTGGYAFVTANTSSEAPFNENEALSIENLEEPVFKTVYLNPGDTYKYINKGPRELEVYKNGLSCDYVIHNADGSIDLYAKDSTNSYFTIPVGGNIVITSDDYIHLKGLYQYFDTEKVEKSVFNVSFCSLGETYQFTNEAAKDIELLLSGSVYDYVIYDADESIYEVGMNATATSISVPPLCKAVITPLVSNISIHSLNEAFGMASERSYQVLKRFDMYYGGSTAMSNISDENRYIYASPANYIDWASFDAGNNAQEAHELVSPYKIEVPASGRVEITPRSSNVTFAGLYEYFSGEDLSVKVTGISLSNSNLVLLGGKQAILRATVTPENATNKAITWTSSDTSVATVAQTGKVTAKGLGTATITATTVDGGYTATCFVSVTDEASTTVSVEGITLDKSELSLKKGNSTALTAMVLPSNATNKTVTWKSSDSSVAAVSNGTVTAKAAGAATITATTADGGYTATCSVTVTEDIVTENAPVITIGAVKAMPGKEIQVTVDLENNTGFANLSIEVGYNNEVLTLTNAVSASTGATFTKAQSYGVNPYNMSWDSTSNVTYNGNLVTLTFKIAEDAADGIYPITLDYYKGVNGNYVDGDNVNYDENFDAVGFVYISGNVNVASYIPGDINGDESIDSKDATYLLRYLAGWNIADLVEDALDIDASGTVDSKDATILLRYLAGWDVTLH